MRSVYLVRHAKSSWENPELRDYDRPLKGRGISDAYLLSQWLKQNVKDPQRLFSSPATRALHTAMIFARTLNIPFNKIEINEDLYMCSSSRLLDFIRGLDDKEDDVMIFAHNPTITDFVNRCQAERIENVPTTGTVCLHFDVDHWRDAQENASLVKFEYPKKLRQRT